MYSHGILFWIWWKCKLVSIERKVDQKPSPPATSEAPDFTIDMRELPPSSFGSSLGSSSLGASSLGSSSLGSSLGSSGTSSFASLGSSVVSNSAMSSSSFFPFCKPSSLAVDFSSVVWVSAPFASSDESAFPSVSSFFSSEPSPFSSDDSPFSSEDSSFFSSADSVFWSDDALAAAFSDSLGMGS